MPDRYHVKTVPMPGRFRRVGRFATVDWREDCARCTNCVKPRCLYEVYDKERDHHRDPLSPVQPVYDCKACLSCVQRCTKGLLDLSVNPEYLAMGDDYWRPDILTTTWAQADTGRIPVSGAGYRGPFAGPGFDSIWTDMSEIVRPTRDGIHGREYISTTVDVGPKPLRLAFSADGDLLTAEARLIELQFPAVLDLQPWPPLNPGLSLARAAAAKDLCTLGMVPLQHLGAVPETHRASTVPVVGRMADIEGCDGLLQGVAMVEILDSPHVLRIAEAISGVCPDAILAARMDLNTDAVDRLLALGREGLKVFHLRADGHGNEKGKDSPRHIKDAVREIHDKLVEAGVRDEMTLIVSGGIALAEHMAKAILCGADLVGVDTALMIALGCRLCQGIGSFDEVCPAQIGEEDVSYASQRFINLMGAWHDQLIEVLGAMGIREVRRLRGEVGRAIFMEEMERDAFSDIERR